MINQTSKQRSNTHLTIVVLALTTLISLSLPSFAAVELVSFEDPKTEKRYKRLITELRCLVCQNQNLADSDAELAKDLRRKTIEMLKSGASDDDVKTYMSDRYGDFILYKPRFNQATALLWLGPFILLFAILIGLFINIRKRQQAELLKPAHASNNHQARVKVRNLLKDTPSIRSDDQSSKASNNSQSKK